MRILRAVRAHGGPVVLLALVVAVVVTAAVLTTNLVEAEDGVRSTTATPLLLLALVVVPVPALELARRRRGELALVRVRGAHGVRLVGLVAGESVAAVAAGGVAGVAGGAVAVRLLHGPWHVADRIGGAGLTAAGLVTGGAALVAAGCAWLVVREPLATAVRRPTWTGPGAAASFVGLVGGVAVLVAALLAVYQSGADDGAGGSLVLAGSALIGIAVGQVVVWALRAAMRRSGRTAGSRSTGLLLGLRRALAAEHAGRLRALVAAGVVVAAATCAVTSAGAWAGDSARLRQGAPLKFGLPDAGSLSTLLLTQRLDPDGRWLMAAAVVADSPDAEQRIAWLDLARFDRVAGDFLEPTSTDVGPRIDALRDAAAVRTITGDTVQVVAAAGPGAGPVTVTLEYLGDEGFVASAVVDVAAGATAAVPVPDCAEACVVIGLSASADVELTGLRLGDTDLLDSERWVGPDGVAADPTALGLVAGVPLVPADAVAPAPMLTAGDPDYTEAPGGEPTVAEIGGSTRPVASLGSRAGLPLVEGAGLLGDLPVALAGARSSVAAVDNLVLARADTPDDVLAGLRDAGAEDPQRVQPSTSALGGRDVAEDRLRRVVAGAGVLLGLLVLTSGRRRRVRAGRRERAALRLVGVAAPELRRADLVETTLLVAVAALATGLGGWVAAVTVVDASGLVPSGPTRLPLGSAVSPLVLVGAALAVAVLVGLGALLVRVGVARRSSPVTLVAEASAEGAG